MGREALSPKFSCGTTVSSEIWTSKVFLTILHDWLLGAAVAWSAGRVSKRAGFKSEGQIGRVRILSEEFFCLLLSA